MKENNNTVGIDRLDKCGYPEIIKFANKELKNTIQTVTEKQIKHLLKIQRETCAREYMSYYAGSTEDFACNPIIADIVNAPEPEFNLVQEIPYTHLHQLVLVIEEFLDPTHPIRHSNSFAYIKALCDVNIYNLLLMGGFGRYLITIGTRSSEYTYTSNQLMQGIPHFKSCYNSGLSEYKALLFLEDYLESINYHDDSQENETKL